jgi:hypothetical protein
MAISNIHTPVLYRGKAAPLLSKGSMPVRPEGAAERRPESMLASRARSQFPWLAGHGNGDSTAPHFLQKKEKRPSGRSIPCLTARMIALGFLPVDSPGHGRPEETIVYHALPRTLATTARSIAGESVPILSDLTGP